VRLLTIKPRGREELSRELLRRGFEGNAVRSALASLEKQGWLDERSAARSLVRARAGKFGRRRIERELAARGFSPESASDALGEVEPQEEERALARAFERMWKSLSGLPPTARRRRIAQGLARRGFPPRKVSEMIAERLKRDQTGLD
jgi:regulatory protein